MIWVHVLHNCPGSALWHSVVSHQPWRMHHSTTGFKFYLLHAWSSHASEPGTEMQEGVGPLPPTQETDRSVWIPGASLAQTGCCRHLRSELREGKYLCVSLCHSFSLLPCLQLFSLACFLYNSAFESLKRSKVWSWILTQKTKNVFQIKWIKKIW